jgi:hypothetical protein
VFGEASSLFHGGGEVEIITQYPIVKYKTDNVTSITLSRQHVYYVSVQVIKIVTGPYTFGGSGIF